MGNKYQAVRGMRDISPAETTAWHHYEQVVLETFRQYDYQEIRIPVVEKTGLFQHSIGEVTDIVEKEMYTFPDRSGDSLTLRPEGTAGCVRAAIQLGLLGQVQKLWYGGPMFRYERPQKGRYRQFHQYGAEVFGLDGPDIDAELILLSRRVWQKLGILDAVELQLNSIGSTQARNRYREKLIQYFESHLDALDEDSKRRVHSNPMRILDSKVPRTQGIVANAPDLIDHLDDDAKRHFEGLQGLLTKAGIEYTINSRLVRGLDYYSKTVFEWVTDKLGAQGTICAGGRYDALVEHLGGRATHAAGFGMGSDRIVALMEEVSVTLPERAPVAYLVMVGDGTLEAGILLAERLRSAFPRLGFVTNCGGGSFKAQMKRADKSGARWAFLLGESELAENKVTVKPLRDEKAEQSLLSEDELIALLGQIRDQLA